MKKLVLLLPMLAGGLMCLAQNVGIGTSTPTEQLHTTGNVRFESLSGIGMRPLFIDSAGRITAPAAPGTIYASSGAIPIPDNGCLSNTGASSMISVTGQPASVNSLKIAVRVNITHAYDGDVRIYLISPGGAIVHLASNVGGNGQNYRGTIFTNESPASIGTASAPFTGRFAPMGGLTAGCLLTPTVASLSTIGGGTVVPNGNWTLKVFDNAANDVGTLDSWQISFDGQGAFGTANATGPVPYFANGNLALSNITNAANGNVGINNPSPTAKLDVAGNVKITDGTQGTGKVLTSDASGNASWQLNPSMNTAFLAGLAADIVAPGTGFTPYTLPFVIASPSTGYTAYNDGPFVPANNGFVAPAAGVYHFDASVAMDNTPFGTISNVSLVAIKNGATLFTHQTSQGAGAARPSVLNLSFTVRLAANDVVKIGLILIGPSSMNVYQRSDTYFSGYRVY